VFGLFHRKEVSVRRLSLLAALISLAPLAGAQAVRLGAAPSPDVAARLAALDPAGALRVVSTHADGTLRRLAGPLPLQGADLAARAGDFAARFAPLFGADENTLLGAAQPRQPRADGSPRAAFLPQLVHGLTVDGAGLMLALDADGRATGAHGWLSVAAQALPAPVVGAAQAEAAALQHLGVDLADLTAAPRSHAAVALHDGAPVVVQRVDLIVRSGLRPMLVDVDAATGAVLSARLNRAEGTGNMVIDGVPLQFPTVSGSGNAYTSVKRAIDHVESATSLGELTGVDIDVPLQLLFGTLTGRFCTVSDFSAILQSIFLQFFFADGSNTNLGGVILEYEAFDHVNAYSWITRSGKAFAKIMGTLPSDTCILTFVNFDDEGLGFPNAFFTPSDFDEEGPFAPGFFVFGDFDFVESIPGGDQFDDLSRDPTVVSHEYFHGVTAFAGLSFGDTGINPGNTPPRAVNEAIADYASTTFHQSPLMGPVVAVSSGAELDIDGDSLRDLSQPLTLPDNLFDVVSVFEPGDPLLPEEHEAGEIFGCALWRLRGNAGKKAADKLIINSLSTWPQTNAQVGFPLVTEGNADEAYAAFYSECFLAILNTALEPGTGKAWKQAGATLGAFLAHGMAEDTGAPVVLPVVETKRTLKVASAFLGTIVEHELVLDLVAGQVLTVTLTSSKKDGALVDFDFPDAAMGDFEFLLPKVVNAAGTKTTQKKITVVNSGQYTFRVSPLDGPGGYTAVVKIK
jgi:hypothetical protein